MNEVKLSGTVVGDIEARSEPNGTESARASLQFHKANGAVLLFCFAERAHKLARFRAGDVVEVSGRLTINKLNHKAAVLVDNIQHLDTQKESPADREDREWNASREFQQHAKVKGDNRWATRAGFVK